MLSERRRLRRLFFEKGACGILFWYFWQEKEIAYENKSK